MIPEPRIREIMAGQAYDSDIVKLCREVLELRERVAVKQSPARCFLCGGPFHGISACDVPTAAVPQRVSGGCNDLPAEWKWVEEGDT